MLKYLLICLSFTALLFILFTIHINDWAFLSEGFVIILLLSIPFLLFALISGGMGGVLLKRSVNNPSVFQKPFRNLQLFLSGIYLVFLIINFHLLSFTNDDAEEDCTEANLTMLSGTPEIADSVQRGSNMAYKSLKNTLRITGKKPSDTFVCITGINYTPVDTIINKQKMKARIIMTLTIAKRKEKYYKYMFYCNDSVGFEGDMRPIAILD